MHSSALLLSILSLASTVIGHGYVQQVVSTNPAATYTGSLPYQDPYMNPFPNRIIRKIPGNGPVTDLNSIDIQCNGYSEGGVVGTVPSSVYATVAAGSQLKLNWTEWPESHVGPIITYMAKVPTGSSITTWSPGTAAVWFKVAQSGKAADGTWAATTGLYATNSVYTFTVPAALAPGQYIIRHEIIALHGAFAYPGVQIYPSCIQVAVTGSGTKTPSSSSLVAFPGAYTTSTPGIVFDVYSNPSLTYPIPGPSVWTG